jgi:hypothetical protein
VQVPAVAQESVRALAQEWAPARAQELGLVPALAEPVGWKRFRQWRERSCRSGTRDRRGGLWIPMGPLARNLLARL